ncbi:MAG TPA: hypothetical protein VLB27_03845, partial [candidate division Zixibacteria bacterium]|nr:hypothetical protein [candidate division Zixibacteria bacterium]
MAFTAPELVRTHLGDLRLGELAMSDVAATLSGTTAQPLPHAALTSDSVVVKARRAVAPVAESRQLSDGWVQLSSTHLIPGTVIAASDTSLGTVYSENIDFIVDHGAGRIRRLTTGA